MKSKDSQMAKDLPGVGITDSQLVKTAHTYAPGYAL